MFVLIHGTNPRKFDVSDGIDQALALLQAVADSQVGAAAAAAASATSVSVGDSTFSKMHVSEQET